jgi:hypothetical protein
VGIESIFRLAAEFGGISVFTIDHRYEGFITVSLFHEAMKMMTSFRANSPN